MLKCRACWSPLICQASSKAVSWQPLFSQGFIAGLSASFKARLGLRTPGHYHGYHLWPLTTNFACLTSHGLPTSPVRGMLLATPFCGCRHWDLVRERDVSSWGVGPALPLQPGSSPARPPPPTSSPCVSMEMAKPWASPPGRPFYSRPHLLALYWFTLEGHMMGRQPTNNLQTTSQSK